jgi:cytochrome c553
MTKLFSLLLISALTFANSAFCDELKGDAQAGSKKIAMCIGCHGISGYQASFPVVYKVPKIAGQSASYITTALNEYKKGERRHPSMRAISRSLTDQDMADISIYYQELGHSDAAPMPAKAKDPEGEAVALVQKGACTSCHGANLSMPIGPNYPKIAGQYADYVLVALRSYKAENQSVWGRNNAIMGGVAKQFNTDELQVLANYVASQQTELHTVPQNKFKFWAAN